MNGHDWLNKPWICTNPHWPNHLTEENLKAMIKEECTGSGTAFPCHAQMVERVLKGKWQRMKNQRMIIKDTLIHRTKHKKQETKDTSRISFQQLNQLN